MPLPPKVRPDRGWKRGDLFLPNEVYSKALSPIVVCVYAYALNVSERKGVYYAADTTAAKDLGLSRWTIRRAKARLVEIGLLRPLSEPGRYRVEHTWKRLHQRTANPRMVDFTAVPRAWVTDPDLDCYARRLLFEYAHHPDKQRTDKSLALVCGMSRWQVQKSRQHLLDGGYLYSPEASKKGRVRPIQVWVKTEEEDAAEGAKDIARWKASHRARRDGDTPDVELAPAPPSPKERGKGYGSHPPPTGDGFLPWFRWRGAQCKVPCPPFGAEDYAIAGRLLRCHGRPRLERLSEAFWHWHSGPLLEGYGHPMRLFAHAIPDIEAVIGEDPAPRPGTVSSEQALLAP
jgi:hypothetical protein